MDRWMDGRMNGWMDECSEEHFSTPNMEGGSEIDEGRRVKS